MWISLDIESVARTDRGAHSLSFNCLKKYSQDINNASFMVEAVYCGDCLSSQNDPVQNVGTVRASNPSLLGKKGKYNFRFLLDGHSLWYVFPAEQFGEGLVWFVLGSPTFLLRMRHDEINIVVYRFKPSLK